jgi:hypothetical protein
MGIRRAGTAGKFCNRSEDPSVGVAAAQVSRQRLANLIAGGMWVVFQQGLGGQHEAGGAVPALTAVIVQKGSLYRVQLAVPGRSLTSQTFDRDHRTAGHLHGQ